MKRTLTYFFMFIFVFGPTSVLAQNSKFQTSINKSKVAVGEQFKLTYTLKAKGNHFHGPLLGNFNVHSGPNQSTNMTYINGSFSQSMTFSYVLSPKKVGKFTISGANIQSGRKRINAESVTIEVVKGSPQQQQRAATNKTTTGTGISDDNLFMDVKVSKRKVYQGEQLSAVFTIYFRVDIVGNEVSKLPSFNGFWTQDVEMPQQAKIYQTTINGVRYQAADLKKTILFPQRSGTLEVDPMAFKCVVRTRQRHSHGIFNGFFGGHKDVEHLVKSKTVKIKVLPLPTAGKPASFKGAVGKFDLKTTVDKEQLKANDAVNLVAKVSGKGNLKLLDPLVVNLPPDMETYDPKITDNVVTRSSGVSGTRTYEYLLIPRHAGEYVIEPIQFSYFDPSKKKYVTLSSPEYRLQVEKGEEGSVATLSSFSKEDLKFIGSDIRFIRTTPIQLKKRDAAFFLSVPFYATYFSPFLFLILFLFVRKKRIEESGNIVLVKRKRATKLAKRRLAIAGKHLKANESGAFHEEVLKGLWGYIGDKLNVPVADLSKKSVVGALTKKRVDQDSIDKFVKILDSCEFARYAPASGEGAMEELYREALKVIKLIEGQIK